ncbi:hypothetical protein [Halegenticoccus soli]|uniref:hypothetical protein n=1 Tax=Halegenticoccus soli TaxID=1985678 RepID=UPI000C6E6199|nr:hypothetical protein [Halegenticoccus soli]
MNNRKLALEVVHRLRDDRRETYKRTSEAITAGDSGPAKGLVSTAEDFLERDLGTTGGVKVMVEEPYVIELTEPAQSTLDDPDLLAVWSDLLELIADDPVTEWSRGEADAW